MKQIQSRLMKFVITLLTTLAVVLLLIQAPSINTLLLQGMINFSLPKGLTIKLAKTQGSFPFDVRIPLISIADDEGEWAFVENFEYSWRGIDVLFGNVHFDFIIADKVQINRLPHVVSQQQKTVIHNKWPHLNIDRINVREVALSPAVVPCGDSFVVQAQVESEYFAQHALTVFIEKENEKNKDEKNVIVTLAIKCSKDQFSLIATFIDQISNIKKYCPLMNLPASQGQASLRLKFFTDYNFDDPYISFKGLITDLETPQTYLADFLNHFVEWKVKVRKHQKGEPNKGLNLDHVFVRTGRNMVVNGSASYEIESGDFSAGMRIISPQIQQFWGMREDMLAGDCVTRVRLQGNLLTRKGKIECETTGLNFYEKPMEKLALKISGRVLDTNFLKGDVTLSLHQGAFETYFISKLKETEPFVWKLDQAEITAPKTKAEGYVIFDGTTGDITANMKGVVSDLAPYGELIGKPMTGKMTFEGRLDRGLALYLSADLEQWQFDFFAGDKLSLKGQLKDLEKELTITGQDVRLNAIPFAKMSGQYRLNKDKGSFSLDALGLDLKKNFN